MQAGVVAAPRRIESERLERLLSRFRGPGWALIPVASIIGVVFMIRYASASARGLTYLALIAVPILAAAALGWAARGGTPLLALLTIPLFVLAWRTPNSLVGEASAALLSALSCVTLGVLLGAVTPSRWLAAGILAMSAADVWLVASDLLQHPNATLVAAAPGGGLPKLQSETFGTVDMGYGDMFVAGLLGAICSAHRRQQWAAALLTFAFACVFDLLFFAVNELPATVPVALALIAMSIFEARRRRASAARGPSPPVAATPPPAT